MLPLKKAQEVKEIVKILNKNARKEAIEHKTAYCPWGEYAVLDTGERFKIKKITVKPKESLSLQMHHHRTEHWVVIRGMAKVRIGDKEFLSMKGRAHLFQNLLYKIRKSRQDSFRNHRSAKRQICGRG